MDDNIRDLIFQAIDQTISESDFDRLQDAIEKSPEVRARYLQAIGLCEALGEIARESTLPVGASGATAAGVLPSNAPSSVEGKRWLNWRLMALAATILVAMTGSAFWLGQQNRPVKTGRVAEEVPANHQVTETRIAGHATLRRAVDVVWSPASTGRREGDILSNGMLAFEEGFAEIDFFCGATLIVEGPAKLQIENDWSVRVDQGRLRATVPPAARGFVVKAADSEIVDLGTEFAVEVGKGNARVEVIDGEVELRGGEHDGTHLLTGESESLKGSWDHAKLSDELSSVRDIQGRQRAAEQLRFDDWKARVDELKADDRLIAYYPIAASQSRRVVRDVSRQESVSDGLLVGPVNRTVGRFGDLSAGLNFDRPGARVRTRIDGEFRAFTFSCWAQINSLEHRYNALFMADSYQTGEPHWQIQSDGRMMFSVMVDDTQEVEFFNQRDQRVVKGAGLHRVYYTEPVWDLSKSGQWIHLVAVYDPAGRRVDQYVDGKRVASEQIVDKFHILSLKIGAAEIGNWGQPFRDSPWFAVRNLNGTIDELAIFNQALNSEEILELYEQGKPLGY